MFTKKSILLLIAICCISFTSYNSNEQLVHNLQEFNQAVKQASPGDEIIMANGVWNNTELVFKQKGTKENPITLRAEENGKVILSGLSNLSISGEYLVVKGLVFKNGYTPTTEVISFKTDSKNLANNCRLTECVVDNFSNPERHESDYWIAVYGKNNRIDHNHIEGKRNLGVTMAVRLTTVESQENNHRIDHNYFGPRPNLGANGGETLRIGTSHFSLTNSKTIVEYNYFDRCNGEHEIISNKSGQNTYRFNTFFECTGTLTMRHGSQTHVEGNVFIGNNKPNTGGVRVINGQQTVIDNYFIGLTGYRFRGAFVIMNGVPNSTINRYHQVKDAVVKNNTFVDCDYIQFCAGSDKERSATPENSLFENNVVYNQKRDSIFTIYDDISGIKFKNNIISSNVVTGIGAGFKKSNMTLVKNNMGFLVPKTKDIKKIFEINKDIATKENTGTTWYSKEYKDVAFNSGKTIKVPAGINTLFEAVKNAVPGDVLELTSSEDYLVTKTIALQFPLTFKSTLDKKPTLYFEKKSLFQIENGGSLSLDGIVIDGKKSPDYAGNSVITTSKYSMTHNYSIEINNCTFQNLDVNHTFDVIQVYKNTFADQITIKNSTFKNINGNILLADKEVDDVGVYNAEYVILKNNSFIDVQGAILNLYRGGTDESTFGPYLDVDHCVFKNIGFSKRNKTDSTISTYGVQVSYIKNSIFYNCKPLKMYLVVGEPIVEIANINFFKTDDMKITGDQKFHTENIFKLDPSFQSEENLMLQQSSPLKGKASDGLDIGLLSK